jgi:hypothetical protein
VPRWAPLLGYGRDFRHGMAGPSKSDVSTRIL